MKDYEESNDYEEHEDREDDDQPQGAETDCPDCGSDAIVNDSGLICSNPNCPNS